MISLQRQERRAFTGLYTISVQKQAKQNRVRVPSIRRFHETGGRSTPAAKPASDPVNGQRHQLSLAGRTLTHRIAATENQATSHASPALSSRHMKISPTARLHLLKMSEISHLSQGENCIAMQARHSNRVPTQNHFLNNFLKDVVRAQNFMRNLLKSNFKFKPTHTTSISAY